MANINHHPRFGSVPETAEKTILIAIYEELVSIRKILEHPTKGAPDDQSQNRFPSRLCPAAVRSRHEGVGPVAR